MKSEIKTAIIMGAVVAVAIMAASVYFASLDMGHQGTGIQSAASGADKSGLKKAPALNGIAGYINTDESLAEELEGKVVLYDIWTYSCINCIRTLPYITAWDEKYSDMGLIIVGIHSPEFEFEKNIENVRAAVNKYGIDYPVVLDNEKEIWDSFGNRYWPRKYIADHEGYIRYDHIGEGSYDETERIIQSLLAERESSLGMQVSAAQPLVDIREFEHETRTPELYFGYNFAFGRSQLGNSEGFQPNMDVSYKVPSQLRENHFYMDGTWKNLGDKMMLASESGRIILPYHAKQVNIVAAGNASLEILIDGNPISPSIAGTDIVDSNRVTVSGPTLYNLVNEQGASRHTIEIRVDGPGFEIYTFTFG